MIFGGRLSQFWTGIGIWWEGGKRTREKNIIACKGVDTWNKSRRPDFFLQPTILLTENETAVWADRHFPCATPFKISWDLAQNPEFWRSVSDHFSDDWSHWYPVMLAFSGEFPMVHPPPQSFKVAEKYVCFFALRAGFVFVFWGAGLNWRLAKGQ